MSMDDADILANLTEPQLEAVTHSDGPMLVVAGAGSGKTRVVTRRIAWLISHGVWPSQILAMTFTNKAAREMKERVTQLTGQTPPNIGTFHGCCARFLRRDIDKIDCGRDRNFTIFDDGEQKTALKQCIRDAGSLPRAITPSLMSTVISNIKNNHCSVLEAIPDDSLKGLSRYIERVAAAYESTLQRCNAFDFDDLLLVTWRLLEECPGMADIYHNRFRYLLVDEYQDTNRIQYELIMKLANEQRNVHVTGDPDQSIYSWRGADYRNIMSFTEDFPDARIVKLEQNYRSTPTILNAANALILNNQNRIPKELFTQNADGFKITEVTTANDLDEADWMTRKIAKLHELGNCWRDCAVFYRTNAQSRPIEEAFVKRGIPYQLLGGIRFYERKEIRDFIALLRLKVNPNDEAAFRRIFDNFPQAAGLGPKTLSALSAAAAEAGQPLLAWLTSEDFLLTLKGNSLKNRRLRGFSAWLKALKQAPVKPVSDAVRAIDFETGFARLLESQYGTDNLENRRENFQSFIARADAFTHSEPDADLAAFMQDVALVADVDNHDPEADSVVLMTLHSSKGLEFPYVVIGGIEEGLLPHGRSLEFDDFGRENQSAIEEERRLFYVGITRAKKALYLSHAAARFNYGKVRYSTFSRFLHEIPEELLHRVVWRNFHEVPVK